MLDVTLTILLTIPGPLAHGGDLQNANRHEHMISYRECFERAGQWEAKALKLPPGSVLKVTCEAKAR